MALQGAVKDSLMDPCDQLRPRLGTLSSHVCEWLQTSPTPISKLGTVSIATCTHVAASECDRANTLAASMAYWGSDSYPIINHRLKGYHRTGYQEDSSLPPENSPESRRVARFVAKGVEKSLDRQSLVYGSGAAYPTGRRLDDRSSVHCSQKYIIIMVSSLLIVAPWRD